MRIVYIYLENFIAVKAAMGLSQLEISLEHVAKNIIQIYGPNFSGKTVLLHQLHPFSSINFDGDERNDLPLIIPGEIGIKKIVYEINGEVYTIVHTYKPTTNNHTVSSSFMHNGEELNVSGGVNTFNAFVEKIIGINKYIFQFVINGTQVTSFGNMGYTQRKQMLNKAMGIDIYDKFHKLSTDDYRYTNKLITSMNATKEFLLASYGSYETLCVRLKDTEAKHQQIFDVMNVTKSQLDSLSGKIHTIKQQNVEQELHDVSAQIQSYNNTVASIGAFSNDAYDRLVDEQIKTNDKLSMVRSDRLLRRKDMDVLYEKANNIQTATDNNRRTVNDYNEMLHLKEELESKINAIQMDIPVSSSSNYLRNMLSLAQTINSICKEIVTSINEHQLKLFTDMIEQGIDIGTFLINEGNVLMDSGKEKNAISRFKSMMNTVDGDYPDDCKQDTCIYKKTVDALNGYFRTYQSASNSGFTQYDIDQMEHAFKNIQTIQRLLRVEVATELQHVFNVPSIMMNLCKHEQGIDTKYIQTLIEEAGKIEMRNNYVQQLSGIEKTLADMKRMMETMNCSDDQTGSLSTIHSQLDTYQTEVSQMDQLINELTDLLAENERKRMAFGEIKNVNIKELNKRFEKLTNLMVALTESQTEYDRLNTIYHDASVQLSILAKELETLRHADDQYRRTVVDIDRYQESDTKYRVIAEATSSTKGKPVIAIREKMELTRPMANRLLDVMYHGEMSFLKPVIDETTFSLPFRNGLKTSQDVKYGSQSESTLLSFALALSMAYHLIPTNISFIPLVDEIDAYCDDVMRDAFVLMLQEIMATLKLEQMFFISHNILPAQYEHSVHVLDISKLRE